MRFKIGPHRYRVEVCPGLLRRDGEPRGAVVHGGMIILSGDMDPEDRLPVLLSQLRLVWELDAGLPMPSTAVAAFAADVFRQLAEQGGECPLLLARPGSKLRGRTAEAVERRIDGQRRRRPLRMLFEDVAGLPVPRLDSEHDGSRRRAGDGRFLDIGRAEERFGRPADELRMLWVAFFGDLAGRGGEKQQRGAA